MSGATRLPFLLLGILSLVMGVLAGLARMGVPVPPVAALQIGAHGPLMVAAFLGTVISLERAVALARPWPYLAPLSAGLGGLALLFGAPVWLAQTLFIAAAALLALASALIVRSQPALYTTTLALGAVAWLLGGISWAAGTVAPAVPWWLAFLVLTIAGERLELSRFLPTPVAAKRLFLAVVGVMLLGLGMAAWQPSSGLAIFSIGLLALSVWLARYDIARRTVRQQGLTRYIAVCLLAGYAWLACGALLGLAGGFAPASPWRDAALHALFLGFVFSMIFGHAPIILPAVTRLKLPYHPAFYVHLVLLHASLVARIAAGMLDDFVLRQWAAIGNAVALLLFVVATLASLVRARSARAGISRAERTG